MEQPLSPQHRSPISAFWLVAWALCLAPAWLLPNHYPPWSAFHLDAWAATAMLLPALWLVARSPVRSNWTAGPLLLLALLLLVGLQHATGLIVHAGVAWINVAYLLGFLIAWQTGSRWERVASGQAADGLFLAIALAAFLSVGLQLHQWLQMDRLDIWSMGGPGIRPFANMGQPNQLATLLLWGLAALFWWWVRGRARPLIVLAAAVFLLFGLALTGSRTAWIAAVLVNLAVWAWRPLWPQRHAPWVVSALTLFYFLAVFSVDVLAQWLLVGADTGMADVMRARTETRPAIWAMFLDAVSMRPWLGFGWGQVAMANTAAALGNPPLQMFFSHSHNLLLDLVLWCGVPVGLGTMAYLVWWLLSRVLRVRQAADAVLMMPLLVVGNHAMFELPLHYAYFLLPVGLWMGALEVRLGIAPVVTSARWVAVAMVSAAAVLLGLIVRDYARVEPAYQNLRYEWARIRTPVTQVPSVLLLTQWRDFVRMVKLDSQADLAGPDIAWVRNMASLFPSPGFFQLEAIVLARNGMPQQAASALAVMCSMSSPGQCHAVQQHWRQRAASDPVLARVPWPPQGAAR